jgi:tetratricopeptide (TPR) repeat protein
MPRLCLIGLIGLFLVVNGCAVIRPAEKRPPAGQKTGQTVAGEEPSGSVKQPLYKKPFLTPKAPSPADRLIEERLALARKYLEEGQYDRIPPLLDEITAQDRGNPAARQIADETYYAMGRDRLKGRRLLEAREAFNRVRTDYKDVEVLQASLAIQLAEMAETHYKTGVKFFINEKLTDAIAEWEKALVCYPGHPKAGQDIENARRLLQKLEKINPRP